MHAAQIIASFVGCIVACWLHCRSLATWRTSAPGHPSEPSYLIGLRYSDQGNHTPDGEDNRSSNMGDRIEILARSESASWCRTHEFLLARTGVLAAQVHHRIQSPVPPPGVFLECPSGCVSSRDAHAIIHSRGGTVEPLLPRNYRARRSRFWCPTVAPARNEPDWVLIFCSRTRRLQRRSLLPIDGLGATCPV